MAPGFGTDRARENRGVQGACAPRRADPPRTAFADASSAPFSIPHNGRVRRRREGNSRVGVFEVLDVIDMVLYGVGALALLLFLVFLGIRSAHRLAGPVASGVTAAAAIAAFAVVIRDARRKRWTPVSIGAVATYALCLVALAVGDAFVA